MITFIFNTLFRALSGAQNGAGYGKNNGAVLGITSLMLLTIGSYGAIVSFSIWLIPAAVGSILQVIWLNTKQGNTKIHLTELITTSFFLLSCFLNAPIAAILSIYPGLVLHKIGVNVLAGNAWNYNGTDDSTGNTVGYPLPKFLKWIEGKKFLKWVITDPIRIPRFKMRTRIIIAIISILMYISYEIIW